MIIFAYLPTVKFIQFSAAGRNLKFYPFALRTAMAPGQDLEFISDTFKVELCDGTTQLLRNCSTWEMLNLPIPVILDIPDRLYADYSISSKFLENALTKHLVQTVGKDALMKEWGIELQPTIVVPRTKHYSWPKGGGESLIRFLGSQELRLSFSSTCGNWFRKRRRY